ncbi:3908_t:CDS:2 [Entrophospora sp. SA101]|nr:3908_t:CDS:2 [Entrophospora sp. SA101]
MATKPELTRTYYQTNKDKIWCYRNQENYFCYDCQRPLIKHRIHKINRFLEETTNLMVSKALCCKCYTSPLYKNQDAANVDYSDCDCQERFSDSYLLGRTQNISQTEDTKNTYYQAQIKAKERGKLENEIVFDYSPYGFELKIRGNYEELEREYKKVASSPDFYLQAPFLTLAEDLLKLIKEDKVEKLIFLSTSDERKYEVFKETFFKLAKLASVGAPLPANIQLRLLSEEMKIQPGANTKCD